MSHEMGKLDVCTLIEILLTTGFFVGAMFILNEKLKDFATENLISELRFSSPDRHDEIMKKYEFLSK